MANNRIFYACQAVALSPQYSEDFTVLHGVQTVGINTTFNLEQAFELGQISIYENIEGLPDVEMTIEKVLDGYPLTYLLATRKPDGTSPGDALVERTKQRCNAILGIYADDQVHVSGDAPIEVLMSGMYISSVSYTIPTDGNCTESVTLVGNNKVWNSGTGAGNTRLFTNDMTQQFWASGIDQPRNLTANATGGIQRRENVRMQNCELPMSIFGIVTSGSGNNYNSTLKAPIAHIQNISISTDTSRENILELGRKAPYYRAPNFPVEVTCEIDVIAVSGDLINVYEEGLPSYVGTKNAGNNTSEETITIVLEDGTSFDLGTKNRLASITYGGGDAGGGNATLKYSFKTYNDLTVIGPSGT